MARAPPSAMVAAALGGHAGILERLLQFDSAAAEQADSKGTTPLMAAALVGSEECLKLLVAASAPSGLMARDDLGRTPLMVGAGGRGEASIVVALIQVGSDLSAKDSAGLTPLAHAARSGNGGALRSLLDAAPAMASIADYEGVAPIAHAAAGGHIGVVELLAATGVSPRLALRAALGGVGSLAGSSTLARAAGVHSILREALAVGASATLLQELVGGMSRKELAAEGCDRADGRSVLHEAVERGLHEQAVALAELLPADCLLEVSDQGLTAIGLAVEADQEELVVLLEHASIMRLSIVLEIVFAPQHQANATRVASTLHSYWPALDVRIRPIILNGGDKGGERAGRSHTFDALLVERWGSSRRSSLLYSQPKGGNAPSERLLWREVSRKLHGNVVLQSI